MSNDASLDINPKSNPVQTVAPAKEDNNMARATDKITALYCRLSVEDTREKGGKDDPSNSIQHQNHPFQGRFLLFAGRARLKRTIKARAVRPSEARETL